MPAPRMRTDEYLRTPEVLVPQELIYGLVREAAAPTPSHQEAVGELFAALRSHLVAHRLGRVWMSPIDVVLARDAGLVVQPDLVVVLARRLRIVTDRVWGAPDLAIEVLSPNLRIGNLDERIGWFGRYGVRECWLVHQIACEIEVVPFAGGVVADRTRFDPSEPIRSAVLPRFTATPDDILGGWAG